MFNVLSRKEVPLFNLSRTEQVRSYILNGLLIEYLPYVKITFILNAVFILHFAVTFNHTTWLTLEFWRFFC